MTVPLYDPKRKRRHSRARYDPAPRRARYVRTVRRYARYAGEKGKLLEPAAAVAAGAVVGGALEGAESHNATAAKYTNWNGLNLVNILGGALIAYFGKKYHPLAKDFGYGMVAEGFAGLGTKIAAGTSTGVGGTAVYDMKQNSTGEWI
ncbi:MAG: hypothetical protein QXL94_04455 [Candidatus Parvarchaeum sp.]